MVSCLLFASELFRESDCCWLMSWPKAPCTEMIKNKIKSNADLPMVILNRASTKSLASGLLTKTNTFNINIINTG